jgi:SNF2 family DNA or RNA helicase
MSESKYLVTILEKMTDPKVIEDENCSICMDVLDNPALTACGHIFCYECLKMCLGEKKRCPMCKADLNGKDLMLVNKKTADEINPLIQKYGSKLGKLISIIRHLVAQDDTRIIVFSQWDDMLNLIGKTLAENEIENGFIKGNVYSRNAAIRKFKAGKNNDGAESKVIMLSLKNAASGTTLTEATHIFFVEPINASREESKAIEGQAIARACRIGQKRKVVVIRIIIEETIEEEIYKKYYNNQIVFNYSDQDLSSEKIIIDDIKEDVKEEVKEVVEEVVEKKKRVYKKKEDDKGEVKKGRKKKVVEITI